MSKISRGTALGRERTMCPLEEGLKAAFHSQPICLPGLVPTPFGRAGESKVFGYAVLKVLSAHHLSLNVRAVREIQSP